MRVTFLTTDGRGEYRERALASWRHVEAVDLRVLYDDQGWGIDLAGRKAIEASLRVDDFGIVAFDDILVAPDILDFFRWAKHAFAADPRVVSVSGWNPGIHLEAPPYRGVRLDHTFRCGVWGTWREKWKRDLLPWYPLADADVSYTHQVYPERGLFEARPLLSRAQTIGATGVHMRPHMMLAHTATPWAGDTQPTDERPWHMTGG